MDRFLFDLNPNPILIYDTETLRILDTNDAFLQNYGYTKSEARELTIEDIRPEEAVDQLYDALEELEEEGIYKKDLATHESKEGETFYVNISSHTYPYKDQDARIVLIYDVTERVEAEQKAQEAFFELNHHMNESPLAMIKWDSQFRIIEWSQRAYEIFGYKKDEVLGEPLRFFHYYQAEDREIVEDNINKVLSGEQDKAKFDIRVYNKDDELVNLRVHSSALRDKEDHLVSVLTLMEDITEQKKTEQKYQRLFENANDGILLAKRDKWVECNEKLLDILGAAREDILGKSPVDFSPEEQPDGAKSSEKIDQKIESALDGKPQVFEWQHLKKDGTPIDVEVSLNRLILAQEVYVQAIIRDLTEQKKAEQKYQRLFENANDGIFLMKGAEFVECNDQVAEIYGCEKDDILGATPIDFSPEFQPDGQESSEKAMKKINNALDGNPQVFEWKHHKKDGTPIDVEVSLNRLNLSDEVYVQAIVRDLTEQKKAQEKLRRSEELFRKLFLKAPGALLMVDRENRVKMVNKSFEDLFGYTEDELLGKDIDKEIVPEDEYDRAPRMPGNEFREGRFYEDVVRYTKEGDPRDILLGAIPVYLDDKPIAGFGIYIDVTEQKENERKLKQSLEEKQVLLEEIHHRVKNNLAIISGLLQLQAFEAESEQAKDALNDSQLRIQSIGIVHELLYQSENFIDISFEDYMTKLVDTIKNTLPFDHQHIDIEFQSGNVSMDINQAIPSAILINELVTNAYKHGFKEKESGTIWIKLDETQDEIVITVKDDGVGLPEGFSIQDQSSIGLNLIQTLTQQLEGTLDYSTGQGAHFRVKFGKNKKRGSSNLHMMNE